MTQDEMADRGARALYGTAMIAFAVQAALAPDGFARLTPGLARSAQALPVTALLAVALAAGGLALAARTTRRTGGIVLAVLFLGLAAALHLPRLLAHPGSGVAWGDGAITLALGGSALIVGAPTSAAAISLGRLLYGLALLSFGVVHLRYHGAIAEMIPGWMPARAAWPYLTGAANLAAGAAFLSGIALRPAAALLAAMFGSWVFIVHLPQVAGAPGDPSAWTALAIAVALCGGACGLAAVAQKRAVADLRSPLGAPVERRA